MKAQSAATVAERNAVQRGLVEAMTALGDKILLAEVAENMNLVSLFKGKDVGTILAEVLGGTKVMPTVKSLADKYVLERAPDLDLVTPRMLAIDIGGSHLKAASRRRGQAPG